MNGIFLKVFGEQRAAKRILHRALEVAREAIGVEIRFPRRVV